MGIQLNKEAYKVLLIDKDIELLKKYMPEHSLEKKHIIDVLNWSVEQIYPSALAKDSTSESGWDLHFVMPPLPEINFLKLRKRKGLTLRNVQELTGISNAYLSQLETGKIKSPGYNVVKQLCDLYRNGA
jgi:DNA-binding Xre family transcriptional regulator